jgi:hypothetical protein
LTRKNAVSGRFLAVYCHNEVKNLFTTTHFAAVPKDWGIGVEMRNPLLLTGLSLLEGCE